MENLKKLTREEMRTVLGGGSTGPQVCGNGSCTSGSDCGAGCNCIKSQCSSVNAGKRDVLTLDMDVNLQPIADLNLNVAL